MCHEILTKAKKVIGAKQAAKAIDKGLAGLVLLAADADDRVVNPLRELCNRKSVPVKIVPTMEELGKTCGIEVGAAAVAVLK